MTNAGNISLTAPITVVDDKTTVSCPALPGGKLAPTAGITCTATYAVSQADLDAGSVTNLATASVRQTVVTSATHPSGTAEVSSDEESETVTALQQPQIGISKIIEPGTASTYAATTDSVSFQFMVTNSGNVTLTEAITVTDLTIPATLSCPATGPVNVAPGGTVSCTTSWTPTQADIDAGSFTNEATAATTFNGAAVQTDPLAPATATATAIKTPAMQMVKALTGLEDGAGNPTADFTTGNVATYSYTITNTGNTTLQGPLTVDDNLIASVTCPATDLAPTDAPLVCTAEYVITDTDISLGSVTNIATATDADGVESAPVDETIPADANPTISMVKTADVTTFTAVGDPIVYTYTVTNTSPGSMTGGVLIRPAFQNPITISDDKFPNDISCNPTADNRLLPDEVTTCVATYLVTQEDQDAVQNDGSGGLTSAFVTNNAVAETTFASTEVVSPAQSVTVNGAANPQMSVTKDVTTGNDPAAVGNELTYTITTTNTGNQRISNVTVTDPLIPALTCSIDGTVVASPFTLEAGLNGAGDAVVCTGTYTVTQADIDAQSLTNTATSEGASPDGTTVTETANDDHPLVPDSGTLTVLKELTTGVASAAYSDVGEGVSFTITVTNDRVVALENIRVTDSRVPGTCVIAGPLAPGESDNSCVFVYTITQDDIDAGKLTNVATAVGTPLTPGATDVSGTDELTVAGPAFEPSLLLAQRDVFLGTGGTVYFLERQDIQSGTARLFAQVRDADTGRIIKTVELQPGTDFTINNIQGIVTLTRPLSGSVDSGLIIQGSDPELVLVAQYEYTPTLTNIDGFAFGGRGEVWATDQLRFGANAMVDESGSTDHKAIGVDVLWRLNDDTYLSAEIARTEGTGFTSTFSNDGGLIVNSDTLATGSGEAVKLDGRVSLADLGYDVEGSVGGYFEHRREGFSNLDYQVLSTTGDETLWGVYADIAPRENLKYAFYADSYENDAGKVDRTFGAETRFALNDRTELGLGVEYVDLNTASDKGTRTDIAARLEHSVSEDLDVYAFGQSSVSVNGLDHADRYGVGTVYRVGDNWTLSGEISDGTEGQGGA